MNQAQLDLARFGLVIAQATCINMATIAVACEQGMAAARFQGNSNTFGALAYAIKSGEVKPTDTLEDIAIAASEVEMTMRELLQSKTLELDATDAAAGMLITAMNELHVKLHNAGFVPPIKEPI